MHHLRFVLMATLIFSAGGMTNAQTDSLVDVFPLAIGNQWTYRYYTDSGLNGSPYFEESDSGRATYVVTGRIDQQDSIVCSVPVLRTWLSITDANGVSDTVWFGVDGTATRSIDPWLCEIEYPPPPPVGVFDVRFVGWTIFPFGQGLKQDYRGLSQGALRDTHIVKFQPSEPSPGYPVTLRWAPSQIAAIWDSVIMTDIFWNGWLFWVNMTHQDSLVIQNSALNGVTLWTRRHPLTEIDTNKALPTVFSLSQNFPNPFNPTTRIEYRIPGWELVTLKVYDVLGREVTTLVNEVKSPGSYYAEFSGVGLASGAYFCRLQAGSFMAQKRLLLLK